MDKVLNKMLVLLNNAIGFMYEQGMTETEIADYLITNVDMLKAIEVGDYETIEKCLPITKYKVFVTVPFGIDDTFYTPYSEIEHTNYEDAKAEYKKAKADEKVIYAKIESWED